MAEIVKKSNHLRHDIWVTKMELLTCGSGIVASILLLGISKGLSMLVIVAALIYILRLVNDLEILQFGLKGEKEVLELLTKLPKNYKVLSDVHLVDGTKSSQIDFVIIGPNGLFIMETKHIKGTINGREDDNYLQKVKIGKNGDRYVKRIYNPIKQILGHKKGMDIFLKKSGITAQAIPMLFFSSDCTMNVPSSKVKIISEPVVVIDYIKRHQEVDVYLTPNKQEAIVEALKNL